MAENQNAENITEPIFDEQSVRELSDLLASISDKDFMYDLFGCLFTPAELKDFGNRWKLVKALDAGKKQREIAKELSMSLCNITRGARELKKENSAFKKLMELYKNQNN